MSAGAPQSGPAAAAGGATVIEAFPGELGAGGAIARAVAHVEIGVDGLTVTGLILLNGSVPPSQTAGYVHFRLGMCHKPESISRWAGIRNPSGNGRLKEPPPIR